MLLDWSRYFPRIRQRFVCVLHRPSGPRWLFRLVGSYRIESNRNTYINGHNGRARADASDTGEIPIGKGAMIFELKG